jgi:nucleoside-diphosphate-sugar epimerase
MRLLLTGAFGNIGESSLLELAKTDHRIRCFDIENRRNRRTARRFRGRIETLWGDLRDRGKVREAVQDTDVVIHLAFVIPSLSSTGIGCEDQPDWARSINIGGTRNLIEAIQAQPKPPRLIFSSSIHVYGNTQGRYPLRKPDEKLEPEGHYAQHKVACEKMVRESGLRWCILRFAAAFPFTINMNLGMFDLPLENRIEYIHTRDVGTAVAHAAVNDQVWGKILLIGGGPKCQLYYRDVVHVMLHAMGVGMLPESAFSHKPFATDWMDTRESQRLLHYQQRDLHDFARELKRRLGVRRWVVRIARPLVRRWLLAQSPFYHPSMPKEWRFFAPLDKVPQL